MILKEYTCASCGDFEGISPICNRCGKIGKRAFRTAPGWSTGGAKRFDKQMEGLVRDRGLTNYSTRDKNMLSWQPHLTADMCQGQWSRPGKFGISTGRRDASGSFAEYERQAFVQPQYEHGAIQADDHVTGGLPKELTERTRNKFIDPRGDPKI